VAAIDPKAAAELEKLKKVQAELAAQKPAFDEAVAAGDAIRLDELADAGNAHAQYERAVRRLASEDYMLQQGGFEDVESASEAGLPEAQLWVGQRMAFGKDGYKLQPSSGLKLMEKAAAAGNLEAILAVAGMYAQDAYMADKTKAREWYQRAADQGSDEAKSWLDTLDADSDS
jgi:TPR repeat protein